MKPKFKARLTLVIITIFAIVGGTYGLSKRATDSVWLRRNPNINKCDLQWQGATLDPLIFPPLQVGVYATDILGAPCPNKVGIYQGA